MCLLIQSNFVWAQNQAVTYLGLGAKRDAYHTELLTEVFRYAPSNNFEVKLYEKPLPHHRGFMFLAEGRDIDLMIGYATEERDEHFRAIPIPIFKGINGWRLSAIHKDNLNIFESVKTLKEFKKFIPGQFHAWTDYKILLANDIFPAAGSDFTGLYAMLNKKRFDYLPRSIVEITSELESFKKDHKFDLVIEPHILIVYPTAFYFYVNKNNTALAENIRMGLENIITNGIFDNIFYKYHGDIISIIERESRRVFRLENPLLPESVPLDRKELWLD